jgi:hypothetical protein
VWLLRALCRHDRFLTHAKKSGGQFLYSHFSIKSPSRLGTGWGSVWIESNPWRNNARNPRTAYSGRMPSGSQQQKSAHRQLGYLRAVIMAFLPIICRTFSRVSFTKKTPASLYAGRGEVYFERHPFRPNARWLSNWAERVALIADGCLLFCLQPVCRGRRLRPRVKQSIDNLPLHGR